MTPEEVREELGNIEWNRIYEIKDTIVAYNFLEESVLEVLDRIAPNKKIQNSKKHKKWISVETRNLMNRREEACIRARQTQDETDWKLYREIRNKCTSECRKDKEKFYENIYNKCEEKSDVKTLYRVTKEQLGWEAGGPPTALIENGKLLTKPKEIANAQMNFFKEKLDKLVEKLPETNKDPIETLEKAIENWTEAGNRTVFEIRKVSKMETLEAIKELSNSPAQGNDKLDNIVLKLAAEILCGPLNHITNLSIENKNFCPK